MKKFVKEQKGITLIALIITIIVMMILVAVTINVALNGGLFDKAKTAKVGTQKEIEREQLLEAVLGAYNNQGSFVIGNVKLPDDMEWADDNKTAYGSNSTATPSNNGNWVATKNGNYFYIDSYGNILDEEPEAPEEPETPEKPDESIVYAPETTLPKITLNTSITSKDWSNRPEYGEGKNAVELQLTINNSSDSDRWYVNVWDRLTVFNDSIESNPYEYYFDDNNGQLSTFTSPGWYRNGELVSETNYPIFDGYHVETDPDVPSNEIEQYYEDLNTWYGDVFVKAD